MYHTDNNAIHKGTYQILVKKVTLAFVDKLSKHLYARRAAAQGKRSKLLGKGVVKRVNGEGIPLQAAW